MTLQKNHSYFKFKFITYSFLIFSIDYFSRERESVVYGLMCARVVMCVNVYIYI